MFLYILHIQGLCQSRLSTAETPCTQDACLLHAVSSWAGPMEVGPAECQADWLASKSP